ncbi:hypothetical protein A8E62_32155 [Burkholderia cenocepacia]|uniref:Uncharacterized protein n=1 Tax=Burkholderia cenocepacia TaxID=95486 RepID=A0A1V2VTT3_9BURK|nr:hypothetical protein A8E62_32155 [Burkholderia cenocepacia]ONU76310.1 hypothetical protein A8E72_33915 [Burkholderia cenocepacia]ONU89012.1 hypothetical protein A8E63_13895 [Burkholderia cenocepacia]
MKCQCRAILPHQFFLLLQFLFFFFAQSSSTSHIHDDFFILLTHIQEAIFFGLVRKFLVEILFLF